MVHLLPKIITALQDKFIIDLSLGDSHCLALTKGKKTKLFHWCTDFEFSIKIASGLKMS